MKFFVFLTTQFHRFCVKFDRSIGFASSSAQLKGGVRLVETVL